MNQKLNELIFKNPFYGQAEKELWLQYAETCNGDQCQKLISHFEKLNHSVENMPPSSEKVRNAYINVLGTLSGEHNKEAFEAVQDKEELTEEEFNAFLSEAENNEEKMAYFFVTLGCDGLEHLTKVLFEKFQSEENDQDLAEFTKTISSISALKQYIHNANTEYLTTLKSLYMQEVEKREVERASKLQRAEEIINNLS